MFKNCTDCPMGKVFCDEAVPMQYALDLIIRQQTEIESLKKAYEIYEESSGLKWAKTEAYKEFAERLKEKTKYAKQIPAGEYFVAVDVEDINNLVKELTEVSNEN